MTFARVISITIATSIAVFLGLTLFSPRHHAEKAQAAVVTPDQVFGAAATPPAPGETPAAAPAETPSPGASGPSAPPATDATPAPAAPAETAAAAPAPAPASAPSSAPSQQGLSDEEARKIAEDVGRKVATRVVEEKSASAAAAPAGDSAPSAPSSSEPAESAPSAATPSTPAPEPTPAPASASSGAATSLTESDVRRIAAEEARRVYAQGGGAAASHPKKIKTQPAAEESAPAAEAAPSAESAASAATPTPVEKPVKTKKHKAGKSSGMAGDLPATDAITAWWLTTDKQPADHLNLVYAGSAATEKSAVLLFSDPVDASAASSHLQLFSTDGKPVSGSWEASPSNPRMLLFKNLSAGRYTVVIAPEITATSGKTITSGLHGPIYIR